MEKPKRAKIQRPRRLTKVDLADIQQRFTVVLARESNRLLDESGEQKLSDESSKALVNYLKLLKELRAQELSDLENLTDEELEKLANKEKET